MGYSMLSTDYRYSEWIGFNPSAFAKNWTRLYARELYDLHEDEREDNNVASDPRHRETVRVLSAKLRHLVG